MSTITRDRTHVEGLAPGIATLLNSTTVPGLLSVSCVKNTIQVDVTEGDFCVRIRPGEGGTVSRLYFTAVYRGPRESGQTWWTDWCLDLKGRRGGSSGVGALILAEIGKSRRKFAEMLAESARLESQPGG
ncbi:hypothetical protein KIK06_19700 [Nocardiopsis sp. EMB25]|uniref:hypothetical protein n=1 Tax=Nocardiopsis sp. EMB25 TaxID=2835867 RepID=UPI0022846269|nr:hypothetical protein [Nocardiopsis sp. EMB25]MCY9786121.1 hypothetical protein [Nocardiopsis sp. EMB25]